MKESRFDIPSYPLGQYLEGFRFAENRKNLQGKNETVHDIVLGIRYFAQKYKQRIGNIMEIGTMIRYMEDNFPGETKDMDLLKSVRGAILGGIEENIREVSSQSQIVEALTTKSKMLSSILNSTSQ